MKYVLAAMYASRTVIIALYLMAPRTALTFYVFAAALGFPGSPPCRPPRAWSASCSARGTWARCSG